MRELVELTKDLIRYKSTHDNPAGIAECMEFIQGYLEDNGLEYSRFESGNYISLSVTPQTGFAPVLLMGHIDVVAAQPEQFDPFEKDGKLYGRGAIDDKYAAAMCMLLAKNWLQKLKEQGKTQADMPFGIVITSDEEVGGHDGAEKVMQQTKCDFCIGLDGGNLDRIVVKAKGLLTLKLICRGQAAHGAQPWLGENAIEKLIEDYQAIKSHFAPKQGNGWQRTISFNLIEAGKSFNQVPDLAEAVFDIRYTDQEDPMQLFEQLQQAVQGELSITQKEATLREIPTPYLDKLREVADPHTLGFEFGASDARFCGAYDIPAIVWGPEGNQSQHTKDEHLDIASAAHLYDIFDKYFAII